MFDSIRFGSVSEKSSTCFTLLNWINRIILDYLRQGYFAVKLYSIFLPIFNSKRKFVILFINIIYFNYLKSCFLFFFLNPF
jgi:hypothetical protein